MEIHAKKEMTDMDEVFKEIRKRKALAENWPQRKTTAKSSASTKELMPMHIVTLLALIALNFFYLKRNIATWKRAKAKHLKSNSEE